MEKEPSRGLSEIKFEIEGWLDGVKKTLSQLPEGKDVNVIKRFSEDLRFKVQQVGVYVDELEGLLLNPPETEHQASNE